jgi:ribosomal protein S18 acetylase RimI-like enzyme
MTHGLAFRPAAASDARQIAEFYRLCSGGVADYIWGRLAADDEHPLDVGERRYAREGVAFSYQNCLLAISGGVPIGMAHAYVIEPSARDGLGGVDPVLRPYAELEIPGSLYISGIAVRSENRNLGIGSKLIELERERARRLGSPNLSALVFEDNHGSLRLLGRHGFEVVDRRPVVPHPVIQHTGDVLLLEAPVQV